MLAYLVALMAAQTPQIATPAPVPSQAQSGAPAKKKRAPQQCSDDEAALGSHIVIPCSQPDEFERSRQAHQAQQAVQFKGVPEGSSGPH